MHPNFRIMRHSRRAAALAAIASILCLALTACAQGPHVEIVAPDGTVRADVAAEIAATPQERETGLMYRSHLGADDGMIFLFTHPQPLQFWMKNTEIPLDMIFANSNRQVVGIVERAEPYSEQLLSAGGDSQYVLEVNGGFCARHGIKAGDHLRFRGVDARAQD
ncbi:MAG TPA: DUF192 domain-containing protein [Candidatus Binataceae bacterium]|nr:DUF192 domain-containing protein [Candidatus Binataceae bacterium]